MSEEYDDFVDELRVATDDIDTKKASESPRMGKAGLRDRVVFIARNIVTRGANWLNLPMKFIMFMGLMPLAIKNVNYVFQFFFGIKPLPIAWTSIFAGLALLAMLGLGYWGYSRGGTEKSQMEWKERQDPVYILQYKYLKRIARKMDSLESRIDKLEEEIGAE